MGFLIRMNRVRRMANGVRGCTQSALDLSRWEVDVMSSGSALFSDVATVSAGPSLHDLLKSIEEGKTVKFTVNGQEFDFRVTGLELTRDVTKMREGDISHHWGVKVLCIRDGKPEKIYQGFYNSRTRDGQFNRPNELF